MPLIIYAPKMKARGGVCRQVVELVDLYPTLTALCGLKPPDGLDGASLEPLLDGIDQPVKAAAFTTASRCENRLESSKMADFLGRSVRTDHWRYTEWDGGKRGVELYDRQSDPQELHNVAHHESNKAVVAELRAMLQGAQSQTVGGQ